MILYLTITLRIEGEKEHPCWAAQEKIPSGTLVGRTWHSSLENSLKSGMDRLVMVIPDTYDIKQINQAISELHALVDARVPG